MEPDRVLKARYQKLFRHLDERQRRLVAATDAERLGRGGVSIVARTSGLSRPTIHKGLRELQGQPLSPGRIRRTGGGRKRVEDVDPSILERLERLMDPATRGDPGPPLRWTSKSTRHLATALTQGGDEVSHETAAQLLRGLGYRLRATTKTGEGTRHPDSDAQFRYINGLSTRYLRQGWPVISVDTRKQELVGPYGRGGQERPLGNPEQVLVHDFIDPAAGKAIPYGIDDIGQNAGWVSVDTDHHTAAFAAESIRRWWHAMGAPQSPGAERLLICADGGWSNGYRSRLWKVELQRLAIETGLKITACHFPPGTSKWNKIEHRLFSHITMNWRGRPPISHAVVVTLIGATKTAGGPRLKVRLDRRKLPIGAQVADEAMKALKLRLHRFHGDWNYTIAP